MKHTFTGKKVYVSAMAHLIVTILATTLLFLPNSAFSDQLDEVLEKSVSFLGGEEGLSGLQQIEIISSGTRFALDEGLVPGQSQPGTFDLNLQWEVKQQRLKLSYDIVTPGFGTERSVTEVVDGVDGFTEGRDGNVRPFGVFAMSSDRVVSIKRHQLLLNPHIFFQDLLRDRGAAQLVSKDRDGDQFNLVQIDDSIAAIFLYLNQETGEIARLETTTSDLLRRDVPLVVIYDQWEDFGNELNFPASVEIYLDGELIHTEQRSEITAGNFLSFDPTTFQRPESLDIQRDATLERRGLAHHQTLQSLAALGFPQDGLQLEVTGTELTPGVWFIGGGSHNSLAVEQEEGVVIVDAPLGPERSRAILKWVKEELESEVTHVVVSHHHVDHSAGVREMAGNGAEIVVHESVSDFWEFVLNNSSSILPDQLERDNQPSVKIEDYGELGQVEDEINTVNAFPYEQTHSVDSVIVEAGGVVFVVDTFSPGFGPASPEVGSAIADAVAEQGLTPAYIAGGHGSFIPWAEFIDGFSQE